MSPTLFRAADLTFLPHIRAYRQGLSVLEASSAFDSTGAKYLWAYLKLADWPLSPSFNSTDFLFFALTLKDESRVTQRTLHKYIVQAYQALLELGCKRLPTSLKPLFKIIKRSVFPNSGLPYGPTRRTYCSISQGDILRWKKNIHKASKLDFIAFNYIFYCIHDTTSSGQFSTGE